MPFNPADYPYLDDIIAQALDDMGWTALTVDQERLIGEFKAAYEAGLLGGAQDISNRLYALHLIPSPEVSIAFNLTNPDALRALADRGLRLVKQLEEGTRAFMLDEIKSAFAENGPGSSGAVVSAIYNRLTAEEQGAFGRKRLATIVQTEMNDVHSSARLEQFKAAGFQKKVWNALVDACPICQANADQGPVPLDFEYESVFGPTGQPAGHPNCFCQILIDVDEAAAIAEGDLNYWDGGEELVTATLIKRTGDEHWVTIDGNHVLIGGEGSGGEGSKGSAAVDGGAPASEDVTTHSPLSGKGYKQAPAFKSTAAAQKWAVEQYPHMEWNLKGIPLKNSQAVVSQFHVLAQDFPEVAGSTYFVGIPEAKSTYGSYFAYNPNSEAATTKEGYILLNPAYFGKPEQFQGVLNRDTTPNNPKNPLPNSWHPEGTNSIEATLTHEFGHRVQFEYKRFPQASFTEYARVSGFGEVGSTVYMFEDRMESKPKISFYGATNKQEAFAEGFSAIYHTPKAKWNEYVTRQHALLTVMGSPKSWHYNTPTQTVKWLTDYPGPHGDDPGWIKVRDEVNNASVAIFGEII